MCQLKEENKEIFQMIKDYSWMSKMITEHEGMDEQFSNDSFLSMLRQDNSEEIKVLKNKIMFVDEGIKNVTDDKSFWILNLLKNGHTAVKIKELIPMSSKTFYQLCDEGIDLMRNSANTEELLKGGDNE